MAGIKPIETVYKGYRFRSRLEARWAVFFDACGVKWEYEPEGFELEDGTWYLPDFYLPEIDTFFECKGVMSDKDAHKIEEFLRCSNKMLVVGYSDMTFAVSCFVEGIHRISEKSGSYLMRCGKCKAPFFLERRSWYEEWNCPRCNNDYFEFLTGGDDPLGDIRQAEGIREAFLTARQARFEHGETPMQRSAESCLKNLRLAQLQNELHRKKTALLTTSNQMQRRQTLVEIMDLNTKLKLLKEEQRREAAADA